MFINFDPKHTGGTYFKINFSGFVEKRNVEEYKVHREKFVKKGRNNANFQRAVFEMDEFVADPNVRIIQKDKHWSQNSGNNVFINILYYI